MIEEEGIPFNIGFSGLNREEVLLYYFPCQIVKKEL